MPRRRSSVLVVAAAIGVIYLWLLLFAALMSLSGDCAGTEASCRAATEAHRGGVLLFGAVILGLTALAWSAVSIGRLLPVVLLAVSVALVLLIEVWKAGSLGALPGPGSIQLLSPPLVILALGAAAQVIADRVPRTADGASRIP